MARHSLGPVVAPLTVLVLALGCTSSGSDQAEPADDLTAFCRRALEVEELSDELALAGLDPISTKAKVAELEDAGRAAAAEAPAEVAAAVEAANDRRAEVAAILERNGYDTLRVVADPDFATLTDEPAGADELEQFLRDECGDATGDVAVGGQDRSDGGGGPAASNVDPGPVATTVPPTEPPTAPAASAGVPGGGGGGAPGPSGPPVVENAAALGALFAEQLGFELSTDEDRCVGAQVATVADPDELAGLDDATIDALSPGVVAAVAQALSLCLDPEQLVEPLADAYFGVIPELTRGQQVCLTRGLVDRFGLGYFLGVPDREPATDDLVALATSCGIDPSLLSAG